MSKYIQIVSISDSSRKEIYGNTKHNNFKWGTEFHRVFLSDVFGDYIPSFHYLVVPLNKYSKQDLVLLHKLNIPDEEVYEVTDQITRRKFSMMFDNFQAYDVQETRQVSREEGRLEGRIEGERAGRIEGEQLHLIKLVIKKIEKQCSAAQISEILEEPLDIIQQIYDISLCQAPDYNADKILKELNSKTVS